MLTTPLTATRQATADCKALKFSQNGSLIWIRINSAIKNTGDYITSTLI